jgi:hypothetical protein|tara:strand:- start:352 stop:567 length:216 start_codon:yes stop_codon:yes gene_type:complete
MQGKLKIDPKWSPLEVKLAKAKRKRDFAEIDLRLEDTCQVRTPAEKEAIDARYYQACDDYNRVFCEWSAEQ